MARKVDKLEDLPLHLRGLSNNRWGSHMANRMRGFGDSKYGAASPVRHIPITPELRLQMQTGKSPKRDAKSHMRLPPCEKPHAKTLL